MNIRQILGPIRLSYHEMKLETELKTICDWKTLLLKDSKTGLAVFLHPKHLQYFIACANSLFSQLGYSLPIYITDDGLLTNNHLNILQNHFQIIYQDVPSRNKLFLEKFHKYTYLSKFRFDSIAPQFRFQYDAYFLNPFQKTIFLDADVLFYKKPIEIDKWIKNDDPHYYYGTCNRDLTSETDQEENEHVIRKLLLKLLKSNTDEFFSNSLLLIPGKEIKFITALNSIHEILYSIGYSHKYLSGETALCAAFGLMHATLLSPERYVNIWLNEQYNLVASSKIYSLHYAFEAKRHLSRDALRLLKTDNIK